MSKTRHAWIVTLSVDLGILIFIPFKVHALTPTVAIVTAWISLLLMQTVVLVALANKSKKIGQPIPPGFYWKAGAIALVVGIVASLLAVSAAATPGSYLDLAQSSMLIDDINPVQKRLVVELLRKDIAYTQENNKVLANTKPVSPAIYSPESFTSVQTMQSVVSQLQDDVAESENYAKQIGDAEQYFRSQMASVDPAYLQSWIASRKEDTEANAESLRLQRIWWDGFVGLYTYTEAHARQIHVNNGKLVITDQATNAEFNQQMDASKQAYNSYLAAVQKCVDIKKKVQM
jgi:hypothetical protein